MNRISFNYIKFPIIIICNFFGVIILGGSIALQGFLYVGIIILILTLSLFTFKINYEIQNSVLSKYYSIAYLKLNFKSKIFEKIIGILIEKETTIIYYRQYSPRSSSVGSMKNEYFILKIVKVEGIHEKILEMESLFDILRLANLISLRLNVPIERRLKEKITKEYGVGPSSDHDEINKGKIVELFYEEVDFDQHKTLKRKKRIIKSIFN